MNMLQRALASWNLDVFIFLKSVEINEEDGSKSHIALREAVSSTRFDVLKFLLDNDADVHAQMMGEGSLLHCAVNYSTNTEIAKMLIRAGISVNERACDGAAPLHHAVRCHWLDMMKVLCKSGADPEANDMYGWTPLHAAAKRGDTSGCHYLIVDQCVSVYTVTKKGTTSYALALKYVNADILDVLLAAGYRPTLKDLEVVDDVPQYATGLAMFRDEADYKKVLKMTRDVVSNVPPLLDMCVFKMRRPFGRRVLTSIKSLDLREALKNRIALTHIVLK